MPGNCSPWYLNPVSSWIMQDTPHRILENHLGADLIKIFTCIESNWKSGTSGYILKLQRAIRGSGNLILRLRGLAGPCHSSVMLQTPPPDFFFTNAAGHQSQRVQARAWISLKVRRVGTHLHRVLISAFTIQLKPSRMWF